MNAPDTPIQPSNASPSPVPFSERIGAMDIARGFALLGILTVNFRFFSSPLGASFLPPGPDTPPLDSAWWFIVYTFGESKFYTLFSLLFGMGFIILTDRARSRRPESATPIALRRFGFLALLGFLHANLFWYGDILFVYAIGGLALLLVRRWKARTLAIVGAALILVAETFVMLSLLLGMLFANTPTSPAEPAPSAIVTPDQPNNDPKIEPTTDPDAQSEPVTTSSDSQTPAQISDPDAAKSKMPAPFRAMQQSPEGPQSPVWMEAETIAYQKGPYLDLAIFRSVTWLAMFVFVIPFMGPRILGLFLIGAALIRSDFFNQSRTRIHRTLIRVGLLVGLPAAALAASGKLFITPGDVTHPLNFVWQALYALGAIAIPFAILGGAALLANRAPASPGLARLLHPFACAGRLGLTNYLTQTLVATTTFYFYGFGLFGKVNGLWPIVFVLGLYGCQLVFSTLYLKRFAIGPAEWLWRTATYLRPVSFRHIKSE
ncbi:MAG: DUF418 domain-containing protein [Phycisphaeraceae bacterium]|nr:MAG: DUF418 domain-containing protein [Phycisphaeraceae bacterium]